MKLTQPAGRLRSGGLRRSLRAVSHGFLLLAALALSAPLDAAERRFAGVVSSATPEATAAGVEVLEQGGNAVDAAVAVSLALAVSEPAGSGIAGQTVMLIAPPGKPAMVINGTSYSPRRLPPDARPEQLVYGHTAASVPSTLRVLDLAWRRFGSAAIAWPELLEPAIRIAEDGFVIGPFRQRAFQHYHPVLVRQPAAASLFVREDGTPLQAGEVLRQPLLARTLRRLAEGGADEFYAGEMARQIAADMAANGGWITAEDLAQFPPPPVVPALRGSYRGYEVSTLPPPFAGWVVLQGLNVLERQDPRTLAVDGASRRLALLDALRVAHGSRRSEPVRDYRNYAEDMARRIDKATVENWIRAAGAAETEGDGGETTHFSVVDGQGLAVAVTQSIDSYFGAGVAHPELGFLYNNYMQGFQLDDPGAPYALEPLQMPKSSMSATVLARDGQPLLALGSPGSARIISAVTQVASYWVDVDQDIVEATAAFRVHVVPPDIAYVEDPEVEHGLLAGLAQRGFRLQRPSFGVALGDLDPYFGGVHAVAREPDGWTGAADPRRDGRVGFAWRHNE